jgi:hypothetical protein
MPRTLPPSISYLVLALSAGVITLAMKGLSGFSVFLVSPFAALAVAAAIAKRNVIVRFAVVLGVLFFALDCFLLYSLMQSGSSTDTIGLAVVKFLQLIGILPLLVAALIVGRGTWRHGRNIV